MEISCSIRGCRSRGYGDNEEVLFFPMPLNDLPKLNKWLLAINDDEFIPSIDMYICSKHFTIKDFVIRHNSDPRLKTTAIPSVFPKILKKEETITIMYEEDEMNNESVKKGDKNILVKVPSTLEDSAISTFRLTLVPSLMTETNSNTLNIQDGLEYFDKKRIEEEEERLKKRILVMNNHLKIQKNEIARLKGILVSNTEDNGTEKLLEILENESEN